MAFTRNSRCDTVDLVQCDGPVEVRGQAPVMADENQARSDGRRLAQQQVDEDLLSLGIERRGRLVGDQDLGAADQRPRGGDALLLADAEFRRRPVPERRVEVELGEQGCSRGAWGSGAARTLAAGLRRCRAAARCRVPKARAAG
jgi:hypothetical protein